MKNALLLVLNLSLFSPLLFFTSPHCFAETSNAQTSSEPEAADRDKDPFLEYFPDYLKNAAKAFQQEDYSKTLSQLKKKKNKSVGTYPDKYHFLAGLTHVKLEQLDEAKVHLEQSAKFRRSNSDTLHNLALVEISLGHLQEAAALLEEAMWFDKYSLRYREESPMVLAQLYAKAEQPEKANLYLEQVQRSNPQTTRANRTLAENYLTLDQKSMALAFARRAHAIDSSEPENQLLVSRVLLHAPDRVLGSRDIMEAKEITSQMLADGELAPQYRQEAFGIFIRSLIENGELDAAEKNLSSARKEFPQYEELNLLTHQLKIEKKALALKGKKKESQTREQSVS